jgi:hypothetical protein
MYFYYLFSITLYIRKAGISVLTTTALIGAGLLLSKFLPAGGCKDFFSDPIALEFCFGLILAHFFHSQATGWAFLRYLWLPGLLPFLLVLICLLFGLFVHHLIERPLLVWLRGYLINRNKQSHSIDQLNGREKV